VHELFGVISAKPVQLFLGDTLGKYNLGLGTKKPFRSKKMLSGQRMKIYSS